MSNSSNNALKIEMGCMRVILTLLFCLFSSLAFAANSKPALGSIAPSSGTSDPYQRVNLTTTYTDPNGYKDIQQARLLINSSTGGSNCFHGYYNRNTNLLYLRDSANKTWLGGFIPGSNQIIENNQTKLYCAQTTISGSANTFKIKWSLTFKSTFTGDKNTYLYVKDNSNASCGWTKKGTWKINPNSAPTVGSIFPSGGLSTVSVPADFTTTYSDPNGWSDIQSAYFLINVSTAGRECFYGYYDQNTNKLYLRNNINDAWLGGYTPGSNNKINNSYAVLDCLKTIVSGSGKLLTVKWSITFKPAFTGAKKLYLYVKDDANAYQGWVNKGALTIQGQAPVLNPIGTKSVNEGQELKFIVSGTDADSDTLTYTAGDLPQGATFNQTTQEFSWTPGPDQGRENPYKITFTVSDGVASDSEEVSITVADLNSYAAIVDDHDKPLPSSGYFFNCTGGDRGLLNTENNSYTWDGASAYKAAVTHIPGSWASAGMWYSLIRVTKDNIPLNFSAVFGPYVKPEYQGKVTGISIMVDSVTSATANHNLELKVELKDANGNLAHAPWIFPDLISQQYPKTFQVDLTSENIGNVKELVWLIDKAVVQDAITVDKVVLKVKTPDLLATETKEQAFLWPYSWLMANYDPVSGMVQDRSNFILGDFENVTATGKAAKIVYYAFKKGYTSQYDAVTIITKIANTLINIIPRGPAGVNTIWPHFTKNGGIEKVWDSEWASGDTAYAALDIITALQMIGDPQNQIPALEQFLKGINWTALILPNGSISHGYSYEGILSPYGWRGFGMESIGVNWAYASATGNTAVMAGPPSDNGSGFNDNAQYPRVFSGTDKWLNNWNTYRNNMANAQIGWYTSAINKYLHSAGLFGLSAAENPEANAYKAYGTGGNGAAEDGNGEIITLHYSGMISDIKPADAKRVWNTLRDRNTTFLQSNIIISPLNNMESMRVNKNTGKCTVNYFKGSWNLALQAEGWAVSDPQIMNDLNAAVQNNAFLKKGFALLKSQPTQVLRVPQDYPTIQAAIDAAKKGDTIMVASGTYQGKILLNKSGIILEGNGDSVIQGASDSAVISCQNIDTDETIIKGFTITGGAYGIKCAGTVKTLKVQGNQITHNVFERSGYGIYLEKGASAVIEGNNITHSARGVETEGSNKVDILNNYFYYCRGSNGAGVLLEGTEALIKGNTFKECWDGAINISADSRADIINNRISSNGSWDQSAGLNINGSTATLKNNIISGNASSHFANSGGLSAYSSEVNILNNVFYGNGGVNVNASAVYVRDTNFKAGNNIFYKNTSGQSTICFAGNANQEFSYNDLWDNTSPTLTVGITSGAGNIEIGPLFLDLTNFHLNAASPGVNSGDPSSEFNDLDGTRNDMGAYGGPHSL